MLFMAIKVTADVKKAKKNLKELKTKSVQRAARNAINDTAFDVRQFVVKTLWPQTFPKRRNDRFPSVYFRVTKRAAYGSLVANVGPNRKLGYKRFVDLQIKGGKKIPRGRYVAVPTRKVQLTQRGPRKNQRPENIKGSFVADITGRGPAIWTRDKPGRQGQRGKLKMWYTLHPSIDMEAVFPYYRLGYAKARQKWPKHFDRELKHELKKLDRN